MQGLKAIDASPEVASGEAAVPFQFEVSWRSLTQPIERTGTVAQTTEPGNAIMADVLAPDVQMNEWETVLPFVKGPDRPVPPVVETAPGVPAVSFAVGLDQGTARNWAAWMIFALLVALASGAAYRTKQQSSGPANDILETAQDVGMTGWMTEWASDSVGSALGRQLSLYRPSTRMSDYRLEFNGRIERRSLGWVFRAADSKNYYVGKLVTSKAGTRLTLVRFAVIGGVERRHVQVSLPVIYSYGALKVRLDAVGSWFTLYVQNLVVANWQDDRLKTGGVGFLNEREEQARVESVRISFQNTGTSQ